MGGLRASGGLLAQDCGLRAITSPKANAPHAPGSPFHSSRFWRHWSSCSWVAKPYFVAADVTSGEKNQSTMKAWRKATSSAVPKKSKDALVWMSENPASRNVLLSSYAICGWPPLAARTPNPRPMTPSQSPLARGRGAIPDIKGEVCLLLKSEQLGGIRRLSEVRAPRPV